MSHASWCPAPPAKICPEPYVVSRGDGWRCLICHHVVDDPLGMNRPATTSAAAPPLERPIEVGDYVRWERSAEYWVEGEATELAIGSVELIVHAHAHWHHTIGHRRRYLLTGEHAGICRRINRPSNRVTPLESPIVVGDYVRWERGPSAPLNWAEGEVVELSSISVKVRIHAQYSKRLARVGELCWLGTEQHMGCTLRRIPRPVAHTVNPLEVKHDGVVLGALLIADRLQRHDQRDLVPLSRVPLTPAQRAAVSAHWSAELRAKVAASDAQRKAREVSVLCQGDYDDDEPWWPR